MFFSSVMFLGLSLGFFSFDVLANDESLPGDAPKITCHSSSSTGEPGATYTSCSTCSSQPGSGSDPGKCKP